MPPPVSNKGFHAVLFITMINIDPDSNDAIACRRASCHTPDAGGRYRIARLEVLISMLPRR